MTQATTKLQEAAKVIQPHLEGSGDATKVINPAEAANMTFIDTLTQPIVWIPLAIIVAVCVIGAIWYFYPRKTDEIPSLEKIHQRIDLSKQAQEAYAATMKPEAGKPANPEPKK